MPISASSPPNPPRPVMAVQGPIAHEQLGITDAHNHVWIAPLPGLNESVPVLDQYDLILEELVEYRARGGESLMDCQPGGCGRDGNKLMELSRAARVNIIACTGFHLKKYYPVEYWLWSASAGKVCESLCSELEQGLAETIDYPTPVRAGFIKIALEAVWSDCPQAALEGAASAARRTGALVEIHTEKGALAEKVCVYFADQGVLPHQLVLCHMDKRPDLSLHKALAGMGALLEYDTFYRPKYNPEKRLWPLIEQMACAGISNRVALATDMADAALYHHIGGGLGLASLPGEIQEKLLQIGTSEIECKQMLGGNIARRLAGII
jgi:predicted metal-dependent phosphotriesterase family hydrolase